MIGFNPGAFVSGYEIGQNRQNKQEALAMQKQQMAQTQQLNQSKIQADNFELNLIQGKMKEMESKYQKQNSANMKVERDTTFNTYLETIKKDTFASDEFGGDIKILQNFSRRMSPDKEVPQVPNSSDQEQIKQMRTIVMNDPLMKDATAEEINKAVNINMKSGEYIASADGTISAVQDSIAALGANIGISASDRWDNFIKVKNQLSLAEKGKLSGDGGTEDQGLVLFNQIQSDKKLIADLNEKGEAVPQELKNRLEHNQNLYNKENLNAESAAKVRKNTKEVEQAYADEKSGNAYKGKGVDVERFQKIQLKDKEKYVKGSTDLIKRAKKNIKVKDRLNELLESSELNSRDAVDKWMTKGSNVVGVDAMQKLKGMFTGTAEEKTAAKKQLDLIQQDAMNRIETSVGWNMVQIIKEISGAAVTNEEREYLLSLVTGGSFENLQALRTKLDEFTNTTTQTAISSINERRTGLKALLPNLAELELKELEAGMSSGKPITEGGAPTMHNVAEAPSTSNPVVAEPSTSESTSVVDSVTAEAQSLLKTADKKRKALYEKARSMKW